ncbi:arylsulfatase [Microbacterium awajiense]|uniref:Arylsulfatase n=1 Tax=Microbacterium awajiense TaxID=415214 RepID=A0ABP7ALB0_9MICO
MRSPNVIQIVVDDMGNGDLSCNNGGASSTPVLDQLAREGVTASQCYSGSPVCAPARAALLTGRYPHRTGAIDTMEARGLDRLHPRERTVADDLKTAGYATGLVGKWHTGAFDMAYHPTHRGFDEFVGFQGGWQDYWDWRIERGGAPLRADGRHLTDVFTAEALDFVRRHADEPFFLHLAYSAPHYPLQAPEALIERFLDGRRTRAVATIYAMMAMVDSGVGSILELLEDLGIAQDTIVMFTSDNGPDQRGVGEESTHRPNLGLRGSKTLVYEGGIRVPLIVRWPAGLGAGEQTNALVHFTDLLPTILDAAGARPSAPVLDGASALDVLRGEPGGQRTRFWQWTRYTPLLESNAAARDGDWKLVWPAWPGSLDASAADMARDVEIKALDALPRIDDDPAPVFVRPSNARPLLFDLRTDPLETTDLAAEHPARVRALHSALENWFDDVERSRADASA